MLRGTVWKTAGLRRFLEITVGRAVLRGRTFRIGRTMLRGLIKTTGGGLARAMLRGTV